MEQNVFISFQVAVTYDDTCNIRKGTVEEYFTNMIKAW